MDLAALPAFLAAFPEVLGGMLKCKNFLKFPRLLCDTQDQDHAHLPISRAEPQGLIRKLGINSLGMSCQFYHLIDRSLTVGPPAWMEQSCKRARIDRRLAQLVVSFASESVGASLGVRPVSLRIFVPSFYLATQH